jgi:hypothetical protein
MRKKSDTYLNWSGHDDQAHLPARASLSWLSSHVHVSIQSTSSIFTCVLLVNRDHQIELALLHRYRLCELQVGIGYTKNQSGASFVKRFDLLKPVMRQPKHLAATVQPTSSSLFLSFFLFQWAGHPAHSRLLVFLLLTRDDPLRSLSQTSKRPRQQRKNFS